MKWMLKCRDCGTTFADNEKLPVKANPSGIMQSHCSKCYGVLDSVPVTVTSTIGAEEWEDDDPDDPDYV